MRGSSTTVRIEDYSQLDGEIAAAARGAGVRSTVGVPIVVAGRHWGAMSGWTTGPEPLPDDAAARLARFNELLATAIANAETREALARLAEQQAALRRIATLVARGTPPSEVFAVVAEEVAHVVDVPFVIVARYDGDWATDCASYPPESGISTVGTRWSLDGTNVMSLVRQRVAPARIDDYSQLDGQIANHARDVGLKHTVGVPILVAGRLWGVMIASTGYPLPGDTAERLARFTELVATAIANAESREALARLAEQQAALRRIATLVARSTAPSEVFAAVADEMARCLGTTDAEVLRYDPDGSAVVVAAHVAPGGGGSPSASVCHWTVTACRRGCCAPAGRRGWITTTTSRALSPPGTASWVRGRASAPRSSSMSTCGEWRLSAPRRPSSCPRTPKNASPNSPIWLPPRSPTPPPDRNCTPARTS